MAYKRLLCFLFFGLCFAAPVTIRQATYTVMFSDTALVVGETLVIRIQTQQKDTARVAVSCAGQSLSPLPIEPGHWQTTYIPDKPGNVTIAVQVWPDKDAIPLTTEQTLFISKTLSPQKITHTLQPPVFALGERTHIQVLIPKPVTRVTVLCGSDTLPLLETGVGLWEGNFVVTTASAGIFINDEQTTVYKPLRFPILEQPQETVAPTDNLSIKGNKSIAYISRTKQGSIENYAEETRREESLNLLITGRQKNVSIDATVFSTTAKNVDKKDDMRIRLYTRDWETYLGDYTETISENSLTFKNKSLRGLRFTYMPTANKYMVFTAKASGTEQIEYLYGNDSQGPFYCAQAPVLPGSERLIVDNVLYVRDRDYSVDYRAGKIIFKNLFRKGQTAELRYEANVATNTNISGLHYMREMETHGFGATYVQAKNTLDEAVTQNAQFTHKIFAVQGQLTINNTVRLQAEQAWSENQPDKNLPIRKAPASAGSLTYSTDTLQAAVSGTKTGRDFIPIGNATLVPGLSRTSLNATYQPTTANLLRTEQTREYQELTSFANTYRYYKAFHTEDFFPEVHALNKQTIQDSISSSGNMRKSLDYTRLELIKSVHPRLRSGITGTQEQAEDTLSEDGRYWQKKSIGGFLQTQDFSGFDALLGTEQSKQIYFDDPQHVSRNSEHIENYAQLHIYPNQFYRLGLETRMIRDTYTGPAEITDAEFSVNPDPTFRANGQYNVQSLQETYASGNYRVQKQKGSFLARWQPYGQMRTTLKYAPMLSLVQADREIVAAKNELKNVLFDLSPWLWLSGKYSYTEQTALAKDLTAIDADILQSENKGFHHIYIVKFSPLEKLDLELKHRASRLIDNQRDTTTTDIYIKGTGREYENGLTLYGRPSRELTLETAYTNEYKDLLFDQPTSMDYKLRTETYRTDAKYRFWYFWTLHLFGSFSSSTDLLKTADNVTHEYTPGVGLAYKISEFAISYDYSRTESTRGEDILYHSHIFSTQYDYSQYIHGSLSRTQVVSERPRYVTTEVIAKCSATF